MQPQIKLNALRKYMENFKDGTRVLTGYGLVGTIVGDNKLCPGYYWISLDKSPSKYGANVRLLSLACLIIIPDKATEDQVMALRNIYGLPTP